jgi:hypothetical protein
MEKPEKTGKRFSCEACDFYTCDKKDYSRHLTTAKHKILINTNKKPEKTEDDESCQYECECGRIYKHAPSLYTHRKRCEVYAEYIKNRPLTSAELDPYMILNIVKQNEDFKALLIEQNTKIMEQNQRIIELAQNNRTVITNNTSNSNNNTNNFNLNVFLNERCKDALNITDFVNSLKLTIADLQETGKLGFVGGISRIFINGLKELDMYTRPVHCTDLKRETIYVKYSDTWEKDDEGKTKMNNAIKRIANKNLILLSEWQKQNPNYEDVDSPENEEYYNLSTQAIGAFTKEDQEKQGDKILRNVLKEVVLDKQKAMG